jgi:hypothetical protein
VSLAPAITDHRRIHSMQRVCFSSPQVCGMFAITCPTPAARGGGPPTRPPTHPRTHLLTAHARDPAATHARPSSHSAAHVVSRRGRSLQNSDPVPQGGATALPATDEQDASAAPPLPVPASALASQLDKAW